jgi:ribonuclease VapC
MLVVDTWALVAIYKEEEEAHGFRAAIMNAAEIAIPASSLVEFRLLRRIPGDRRRWIEQLLALFGVTVVPIDRAVADIAADAADRYGHGSGHPAQLNFGDCLSYVVAKHLDAPLLFKGDDFGQTDIRSAVAA